MRFTGPGELILLDNLGNPVLSRVERYAIDPAWRGELPRSYLFDAAHKRAAHSGLMNETQLRDWLKRQRMGR